MEDGNDPNIVDNNNPSDNDSDSDEDVNELALNMNMIQPLFLHDNDEEDDTDEEDLEADYEIRNNSDGELISEDVDESENIKSPSDITFDKSLPGAHSYLGNDLEEVRGRTIHEDDSYLTLPLLSLPGVVLVPGQTLPLHLFQPATVSMIRHIVDHDKTFGLITSRYMGREYSPTLASIGTTAEILAIKEESDDSVGITTVRVKAIGRQRFEIKDTRRQSDGITQAKVRILPERLLEPALEGCEPPSWRRLRAGQDCPVTKGPAAGGTGEGDVAAVLQNWLKCNKKRKIDRHTSAHLTWWPPWVYKQYDAQLVMCRVRDELMSWNDTLKKEQMPSDPVEFSYWVAGNLPLDDSMKLHLLRIDCAVQRLRCELSIMQKCTVLCCADCGLLMASKNDVFSLCLEGPMSAFVNPGGYVHETLTVYKSQGLSLTGRPSTENSWFPGYAWTIANCLNCHRHMGWKFTAVQTSLKPQKFWGLTRSALVPGLQKDEREEAGEEWTPIM